MSSNAAPALRAYALVNDAINRVVFDGRNKAAPVYLDIEGDTAEEIAGHIGVAATECLDVVANSVAGTLTWSQGDPFTWHLSELQAWNDLDRFGPPPFTGLLAALSLAAERMRSDEEYSAQNYYERLFEVLDVTNESRKNSLRQNAKSTKAFWHALNRWLAEHDFDYGRPTARQINHWSYASYALSQALVRDADRKRLHSLFSEYGLAPRERLTDAEMTLYLHEWMGGASPSAWLKRIWATPDLRPRLAAAACSELEAWEGEANERVEGSAQRRLSWAAALQVFPRPQLRMFMSAANPGEGRTLRVALAPNSSAAAKAAFEGCAQGLYLTPSTDGEISFMEPVTDIALSPLMLASFQLKADEEALSFHRAARSIVPLVKLDTGAFYREVSRVSYLRPHLVLCHEQWRDRATRLLTLNARQGFKTWTPRDLPGLPEDWVLFSGVEILRLPSSANSDLQALVPLAEGVSIEMAGGLRLSDALWHADAPPEITAIGPAGPLRLELHDSAGELKASAVSKGTSCRLSLSRDDDWDALDLTLTAYVADKPRSEIGVSFRGATYPRRLSGAQSRSYRVGSDDPAGLFTASLDSGKASSGLQVQGLNFHGVWRMQAPRDGLVAQALAGAEAEDEVPVELEEDYRLHKVGGLEETCVLRGYHHWICDEYRAGENPRDDKWMTCRACGNRVLTRNRGSSPKKAASRLGHRPSAQQVAAPPPMRARESSSPGPDLILDALCYLGSGSWRKLQDLATSDGQEPLAAQRFGGALISLGHIDVILDDRLRAPITWAMARPSMVFTPSGTAFLAGFRNAALIEAVTGRMSEAGGVLDLVAQDNAPTAYRWNDLDPDAAAMGLEGLVDVHGRPITISKGFTAAFAATVPSTSELQAAMPAIHLDSPRDLQRFDPRSGSWHTVKAIDREGAYRGDYGGRRYVYVDATGEQREGAFNLVKLIAARAEGLMLHSYDASRKVFQAVLGCEPPGLYQRALTANSGLLPMRVGRTIQYIDVSAADAAAILTKLYS